MSIITLLFGAAYVGGALGISSTWTVVFDIGASAAASYLVMSLLALSEKIRNSILFAKMGRRTILLAVVYGPVLAGFSYWIYQAGSVEALPLLPYFIGIFYAWILSQAYFIANPITHAMLRFENKLVGEGFFKRMARTLGTTVLFLPIAPLGFGIYEISSWAKQQYANVNGSDTYILAWTLIVAACLVATYGVVIKWGWKNIRNGRPQVAIFAGGTFFVVWGYLLYRAATTLMAAITQNQPSLPIVDIGLMIISILGAMQTFARKAVNMADKRWSQALPFVVFSFGSVYAVAQYYFILQGGLTRAGLSAIVNGTVFAVGTVTLLLLLRHHLKMPGTTPAPSSVSHEDDSAPTPAIEEAAASDHESQFLTHQDVDAQPEASDLGEDSNLQDANEGQRGPNDPSDSDN